MCTSAQLPGGAGEGGPSEGRDLTREPRLLRQKPCPLQLAGRPPRPSGALGLPGAGRVCTQLAARPAATPTWVTVSPGVLGTP